MASSRRLIVEIVGDSRSYERATGRASIATTKFNRDLQQVSGATSKLDKLSALKGLGAGLIAGEVIGKASQFVGIASNLNEQIAKSQVVFGASSASIQEWAKTTAAGIGIAEDQALEAVGTFGNMTRSMGLTESESAGLSQTMVNLAGDLASFNNASPEDALNALRSAISGEYEPLRRFGSALSEARVQQQAMAETGKASAKELTNQEKVLARYHLVLKDTTLAQGDFARTSDGLANSQRILAAEARNLEANLGKLLVPAFATLTSGLADATENANALFEALGKIAKFQMPDFGNFTAPDALKPPSGFDTPSSGNPVFDRIFKPVYEGSLKALREIGLAPTPTGFPGVGAGTSDPSGGFRLPGAASSPASIFGSARAPLTNIPLGFQNAILSAQNDNNRGALTKALIKTRQFEEQQLTRAIDAGDTKAVNQIRSNIESLQGQIAGIYAEIAAETEQAKNDVKRASDAATAKAKDAAAKAKRKREEAAQRLADALQAQGREVAGQTPGEAERLGAMGAIKDIVNVSDQIDEFFQGKADDIQSAASALLDQQQSAADTSRALRDAKDKLRVANLVGGKIGIRTAREEFADAQRARTRFELESAKLTGSAKGVTINGGITIPISGADDPEEVARKVVAAIRRMDRHGAPQFTGRLPGVHAR